jgi:hypothetical protein
MPTALIAEDEPMLRAQLKARLAEAWPELVAVAEGAIDCLLKPVTPERMAKVTARVKARLATPPLDLTALLLKLAEREDAGVPLKWIRASLGNVMQMIAVADVVYFQAEDKYTKVVTHESEALIKKPIKDLFDELDQEVFWQIHRATIVNLHAIARVERDWRDQPVITLKSRPEKLTVSRTFARRSRRCNAKRGQTRLSRNRRPRHPRPAVRDAFSAQLSVIGVRDVFPRIVRYPCGQRGQIHL